MKQKILRAIEIIETVIFIVKQIKEMIDAAKGDQKSDNPATATTRQTDNSKTPHNFTDDE